MEKFEIEITKHRYPCECNACHKKSRVLFTLIVGDTKLIRMCGKCKGKLKRVVNNKIKEKK